MNDLNKAVVAALAANWRGACVAYRAARTVCRPGDAAARAARQDAADAYREACEAFDAALDVLRALD